jgi:flavin reductase (DIM6/NTAB) family NADH-FMN oxidoreductase RutF
MVTVRQLVKGALFGAADFSRFRPIALEEPQSEVGVWLHGLGPARDVTASNLVASASPVTIGIGMEAPLDVAALRRSPVSLKFRERGRGRRVLGEIGLSLAQVIPAGGRQLCLFTARDCANFCLCRPWLWSRYAYYAWRRRSAGNPPGTRTTLAEERSLFVFYICPRPVHLASVSDGTAFNMIPLDLMGQVAGEHLGLTVQSTSSVVPLVGRSRRIALSSVPAEHTSVAYDMGRNHREPSIEAAGLPFPLAASKAFGLPVPDFALRVREFEVEAARTIGGYTLFLARLVEDERRGEGPQFFLVHGFCKRPAAGSPA